MTQSILLDVISQSSSSLVSLIDMSATPDSDSDSAPDCTLDTDSDAIISLC
eukprot:CAMPEP_0182430748 /NCGR_PEP_ID=MMETSP1167-20130531/43061_1 /TAXON_ID=2988 /ORGANISM="Mallomonas Sp, Strain CCMP3275" /LENGTH=50 /DNA_ID=CAMNT_0024616195 /DNA_START=185 /DNA_END=334 /DNA_ORIENTATION=+